jgi:hypothetical protein
MRSIVESRVPIDGHPPIVSRPSLMRASPAGGTSFATTITAEKT